jgi:hypothetical protein
MEAQRQLELTLKAAATDGIAYFVDASGVQYFRPRDGNPIRPLIWGKDNHPMMYQFSRPHPLAEVGRTFTSLEAADHYVGALADFDRMISLVNITNSNLSEELRKRASAAVVSEQERMKKDNLGVLDSVPGFESVRKYLDMTPEQIYEDLKIHGITIETFL